jgi:hypothetical protein
MTSVEWRPRIIPGFRPTDLKVLASVLLRRVQEEIAGVGAVNGGVAAYT